MQRMQSVNLTDHFLIAMPAMGDPYFARTLVYIAEHNARGALGLIVNRPLDMSLATLFEKIDIVLAREDGGASEGGERSGQGRRFDRISVCFGGPVQTDRGFVLHRPVGDWQSTLAINADTGLTSSRDVLQAVAANGQPQDILVTLGYAGWAAGQLEQELAQNAWLTVPAQPRILFELPYEDRLAAAMEVLGIDFTHLAEDAGHA
jgi:putative transcriptional regulator